MRTRTLQESLAEGLITVRRGKHRNNVGNEAMTRLYVYNSRKAFRLLVTAWEEKLALGVPRDALGAMAMLDAVVDASPIKDVTLPGLGAAWDFHFVNSADPADGRTYYLDKEYEVASRIVTFNDTHGREE